jgi:nucleotide-binding universal stress UspA family protein
MVVLVGVDGSRGARRALRWASDRAQSRTETVLAASSWAYPRTAALPGGPALLSPDEMDAQTLEDLRSVVIDELGDAGQQIETVVERGPADWALLNLAEREGAALLVVGKRGLGKLEGRLLGSVSRRAAELAPCPAVVVPVEFGDDRGPVVVGVDGSAEAAAAVEWAIAEARADGVGIVVVHGIAGLPAELPPSALERFVEQARDLARTHADRVTEAGVDADIVVEVVDPRHLLTTVGAERGASLIVVGAKGEGAAAGLLIGSVVNHVVQQSTRPVAVVRGTHRLAR